MPKGMRNVVVLAAGLCLSGCHFFRSSSHSCQLDTDGYRKATSVPALRVPMGIDPPDTKSVLQIPALNSPEPPPRAGNDPCLDAPPRFSEPKGPRAPPAA